jgi:protein-L-isoaspartate O-methyltransferase
MVWLLLGWLAEAPFDASALDQELVVIDKDPDGKIRRRSVLPVRFVPMVRPGR